MTWRLLAVAMVFVFSISFMSVGHTTQVTSCDPFITFSSSTDQSCTPALSTSTTTTTTTTTSTTTTTQAVDLSINLVSGWNLLGNFYGSPIVTSSAFSDSSLITTVWKWQSEFFKWAVYSPSLVAQGGSKMQEYANSINADVLQSIGPGEGYWVNANKSGNVSPGAASFGGLTPLISSSWAQVCACQLGGFSNFIDALTSHLPPNDVGKVSSVWKWNTSSSKWSYYSLSAPETSTSFAANNSLNVLTDIRLGEGVWVGFNNTSDQAPPSVGVLPQTQSQAPPDYSGQFVLSPSPPTGVTATAGNASATVTFSAPSNNGGASVSAYTVTASPGGRTASGSSTSLTVTGLSNGTTYTFTVTATNSVGTSAVSSASNSVTPVWPDATVSLLQGWNLIGNGHEVSIAMASTFFDPAKVVTVWKWSANQSKWAFYTPSLTSQNLSTYANNKGYDLLSEISPGEGFWVNAKTAFDLILPTGLATNSYDFQADASKALPRGWSLIAVGDQKTPSEFNIALSATPPTTSTAPPNITTLWAWDAQATNWMFFAPSLVNSGTLGNYITSKGYLNFGTKTLAPAMGFWVNKP